MGSQKRIAKVRVALRLQITNVSNRMQELSELVESPPPGIKVELADESDIYKWKVYMEGPEDSPYQVRYAKLYKIK